MKTIRFKYLIYPVLIILLQTIFLYPCPAQDNSSDLPVPEFTATFVEDSQPVHITSPNFEIPDSLQPESITINLKNMFIGDILEAEVSGTAITGTYSQGNLILSGNDTLENYNKVLRSVVFSSDKQNPSEEIRIIEISVSISDPNAGAAIVPVAKTKINIIPINDRPVLDLDLSNDDKTGYTAVFKENSNSINIVPQNFELSDIDNTSLYGFSAEIINAQPGDRLEAEALGTSINISFSDNVLTLSGEDKIENYKDVISSLKLFYDTAETDRIIALTARDNLRESDIAISIITQNSYNPVVARTTTFREGDEFAEIAGQKASLQDTTDSGFDELKVILKNPKLGDILETDISGTSISLSYDSGTLLLTGHDTKENYEHALRNVKFKNDSQNPDQTRRVFDFSAKTGDLSSNIATIILAVIAVNDPPENTIPGPQSIRENTSLTFSSPGNPISINDIDAQENDIQVSLDVAQGFLSVQGNTGAEISGNNSPILVLKGSKSQVNSELDGLQYDPVQDWIGSVMLTIKTNDLGNTGIHGPLEDISTVNIIVSSSSTGSDGPTADAGTDQTIDESALVTLNGSDSHAPNGSISRYEWIQTQGTEVVLSGQDTEHPFFTAPETDENGIVLSFKLTITDSQGTQDSDTVSIYVKDKTAEPDPGQVSAEYDEGVTIMLEAPDTEDQVISYEWKQISGPGVLLSNPRNSTPSFIAPVIGSGYEILVFELKTENVNHEIKTHEIKIKINDNNITGYPDNVLTFKPTSETTMGIRVNQGNLVSIKRVNPDKILEDQNRPSDFIYGLLDIQIQVSEPGKTATVEIYFQEPPDTGLTWIKYQADRGWFDYDDAMFNNDRSMVTLTFTDGGIGDDDNTADGLINDLSGLGRFPGSSESPDDEDDGSSSGCFINTVFPKISD